MQGVIPTTKDINYQYGYISELRNTLEQYSKSTDFMIKKFPLVWVRQPFTLTVNDPQGLYASVDNLIILIVNESTKDRTAVRRMDENFKPIIDPIYRELLNQLNLHPAISFEPLRTHKTTDLYFWNSTEFVDVIDCKEVSELKLAINNNPNCQPTKSF